MKLESTQSATDPSTAIYEPRRFVESRPSPECFEKAIGYRGLEMQRQI